MKKVGNLIYFLIFCYFIAFFGWPTIKEKLNLLGSQAIHETAFVHVNAESPAISTAEAAVPEQLSINAPKVERAVVDVVNLFAIRYKETSNEMAAGALRPERARALCKELPRALAADWTGTVEVLSSNNDGDGVLAVRVSPTMSVTTLGSSFGDSEKRTLIPNGSALHKVAVGLRIGQPVTFSGFFFDSKSDCVQDMSLTVNGDMTDPSFLFRFTALRGQ